MRRDGRALDLEAGLRDALGSLPRVACPDLAVETIVGRWHHQRRRRLIGGLLAALIAGIAGPGLLSGPQKRAAPVNLRLRLVDSRAVAPLAGAVQPAATEGAARDWDGLVEGLPAEVEAP